MSLVSSAIFSRRCSGSDSRVLMLCSRSQNLIRMTRISLTIESSILRNPSAWVVSRLIMIPEILVSPSTMSATSDAEFGDNIFVGVTAVFDHIMQQRRRDRYAIERQLVEQEWWPLRPDGRKTVRRKLASRPREPDST